MNAMDYAKIIGWLQGNINFAARDIRLGNYDIALRILEEAGNLAEDEIMWRVKEMEAER